MAILGDKRKRRRDLPGEEGAQLLGRLVDHAAEGAKDVLGGVQLEEDRPPIDHRHGVKLELERGYDTEVAAPAPQRPEQILVLVGTGGERLAVGGHHVGRNEVVDRQAVASGEVADAPTEGESAHTGGRHDPAGGSQAVGVGGVVQVAEQGAPTAPRPPVPGVDSDPSHR